MSRSLPVASILILIILLMVSDAQSGNNAPTPNINKTGDETAEVTLFHNIRFQGLNRTYEILPGQCIGLDANIRNEASSFNGTCAILFAGLGCTGKQKKFEGAVATMPFGWNNEVESIGSCIGEVKTEDFKNILTLYENEHFRGRSHILQPSPGPGMCANLEGYQAWASSVKVVGCIRTWTRYNCSGKHLDIREDREDLTSVGFNDVIMSTELCTNELRTTKRPDNSTEVTLYSDTHRRGKQGVYYLSPGQCINFRGSGFGGMDYPKSIDADCAYLYGEKDCKGKRLKAIGSNLNLVQDFIGADSVESCERGPNASNASYVMLVRNDGLKSPFFFTLEPTQCINLMFEFEKADFLNYDAECAILFSDRWCRGAMVEVTGINPFPAGWKNRVSSVGSCVGPIQPPPANRTLVTVKSRSDTYTVEIPDGPCVNLNKGRYWGQIDASFVSTSGCVYWYNDASDCSTMRRKVNRGTVESSAFDKGRDTWSRPYVGSLQTCSDYTSGPSYVAIYEYPHLNIGHNHFVGFKLEPKSCINLWGTRDNWVASIDVDCAIIFDGHWCTEEQKKIVGGVEQLGNWKYRISSIGSCDGPIPTGRGQNSSLVIFYTNVGLEGATRQYELKSGECIAFSEYADNPSSASSDGCVQLYDSNRQCGGDFKRLDGNIEDLMDWSNDKYKYSAYRPKSGRRCEN